MNERLTVDLAHIIFCPSIIRQLCVLIYFVEGQRDDETNHTAVVLYKLKIRSSVSKRLVQRQSCSQRRIVGSNSPLRVDGVLAYYNILSFGVTYVRLIRQGSLLACIHPTARSLNTQLGCIDRWEKKHRLQRFTYTLCPKPNMCTLDSLSSSPRPRFYTIPIRGHLVSSQR